MASTVLGLTAQPTVFEHTIGYHSLTMSGMYGPYMFMMPRIGDPVPDGPNVLSINSDKPKILVSLNAGPYHFFNDSVGPLLQILEMVPDAEVYIDSTHIEFDRHNKFYNFVFDLLSDMGVPFYEVNTRKFEFINLSNFYYMISTVYTHDAGNRIFNAAKRYIKDLDVKPFRNVYLSRKYMVNRVFENQMHDGLTVKHDNRIDDESILEEYFASRGFEIIRPEEFKSFQEQINFFYETKTLISLTSSGMTNAIFMQPGNTMIELMTPLVTFHGAPTETEKAHAQEAQHHFYHIIALNRNHKYLGLNNMDRDAKKIINTIESDENIKLFFDRL